MSPPALLALWSAPRSRSTAFLRMMAERGDFAIVHEPLSHVVDFGVTEIGGAAVRSERDALTALLELSERTPVFFKDTTDFRYPVLLEHEEFLRRTTHAFLIRSPRDAIASHHRVDPDATCAQIGFERLHEIYETVVRLTGRRPCVIEADDLVRAPAETVRLFCEAVAIDHRPDALEWETGWRPEWQRADRWHVEASERSGFTAPVGPAAHAVELDEHWQRYERHHLPFYEKLLAVATRP